MTGAPFPVGADTAVKQEDTDYGEDMVQIYKSQKPWDNYCFQGEDYKKETLLLKKAPGSPLQNRESWPGLDGQR